MLDFDAPATSFKVKGQVYYLEPLSFSDVPTAGAALQVDDVRVQAEQLVELLASKARCAVPGWRLWLTRKPKPADAVRALGVPQQARLFGDWLGELKSRGVVPGESSGSAN
jgi:hypothetical protein